MINNRELALLIWLGVVLAGLLLARDLRSSLFGVVQAALHPILVVLVLLMAGWVAGLIVIAAGIGWWEVELATDTVVWFVGTALVLMFGVAEAVGKERFLSQSILRAVKVTVFVEVFVNLYVFSLPVELVLLPVVTVLLMLSAVAGSEQRFASVKLLVDTVVALVGFSLLAYVVGQIITDWQDFDKSGALRKFALPVWLTAGIVPLVYLFGIYVAYDGAFRRIDSATTNGRGRLRAKIALALGLRLRTPQLAGITPYWANQVAGATSFRDSRQAVAGYVAWRRERQQAEAEAQGRLERYVGVDGVDDEGLSLDRREFSETKQALLALAAAQMGWYRNKGGRYRDELIEILQPRFEAYGLPGDHRISLWVADDGQSWWAYRRTVTGWCFAVGATAPPPDQWLYDGPEPPAGPPGEDEAWGERWGIDAKNW